MHGGEWIAKHINVAFDSLPSGWVVEQNVMDPVWTSLALRGLNVYAYGGPVAPQQFAARSDPSSPLYQAWFGAYLIPDSSAARTDIATQLGALDQRSWLAAMGDPHPTYEVTRTRPRGTIDIDGLGRPLYSFDAKSCASTPKFPHFLNRQIPARG